MKGIIKIFYAPEETFREIKEKGINIWIPFIILLILSLIITLLYANFIFYPKRIEFIRSGEIPPETLERAEKFMSRPFLILTSIIQTLIGLPLILIIFSFAYHFGAELLGGKSRFELAFLYVIYSRFINVLSHIIKFPLAVLTKKVVVHTDLSLFFPFIKGKNFFYLLLTKIDIFTIWSLYVIVCGMTILSDVQKKRATVFVYLLWLLIAFILSILGLFGKGKI